jgi:hypothetical protein
MSAEDVQSLRDEIEELRLQRTDLRKLSAFHEAESLRAQQDAKHLWEGRESAREEVARLTTLLEAATSCTEEAARWKEEAQALREESRSRKAAAESARVTALLSAAKQQEDEIKMLKGELEAVKGDIGQDQNGSEGAGSRDEEINQLKTALHQALEVNAMYEVTLERSVANGEVAYEQCRRVAKALESVWVAAQTHRNTLDQAGNIVAIVLDSLQRVQSNVGRLKPGKTDADKEEIISMQLQVQGLQEQYRSLNTALEEERGVRRSLLIRFPLS